MSSSEDFYDPMSAFYDSGVDYITREKHRLVSIAQSGQNTLFDFLHSYDEFSEKLVIPFSKEQMELDIKLVSNLEKKFVDIDEVISSEDDQKYVYLYDYEKGIKELDEVLLKYAEWIDEIV